MEWLSAKDMSNKFGVTNCTILRWCKNGKLQSKLTPSGRKAYCVVNNEINKNDRVDIAYCRVSSINQKDDLLRQINYMKETNSNFMIIKDIASGLNFKRPGLKTLIDLIELDKVNSITIAYRDRLCRFGFDFFE
jgi:putative resolvase